MKPWQLWEGQIAAWLELGAWRFVHIHDSRRSAGRGFPDFLAFKYPRKLAIECKTGAGETNDDQDAWRDELVQAGFDWVLWRPEHALEARLTLLAGMSARDLVVRSTLLDQQRRARRQQKRSSRDGESLELLKHATGRKVPMRSARVYQPGRRP